MDLQSESRSNIQPVFPRWYVFLSFSSLGGTKRRNPKAIHDRLLIPLCLMVSSCFFRFFWWLNHVNPPFWSLGTPSSWPGSRAEVSSGGAHGPGGQDFQKWGYPNSWMKSYLNMDKYGWFWGPMEMETPIWNHMEIWWHPIAAFLLDICWISSAFLKILSLDPTVALLDGGSFARARGEELGSPKESPPIAAVFYSLEQGLIKVPRHFALHVRSQRQVYVRIGHA